MGRKVFFVAGGDLLEKGLGVCADPQDPRLEYHVVCPKCPLQASQLTDVQASAIYPVLCNKYPEFNWQVVRVDEHRSGLYWIKGYEYA